MGIFEGQTWSENCFVVSAMTRTKASFLTSSFVSSLGLLGALGLVLAQPREAKACGGCFAPQDPPTVVTGHRMVMSVSPTQSVLWDQIQYSGEPEDFAWVLPVKAGARVEASTAAFFEVLEANTALRVIPPQLDCGGGSSSGCLVSNDLAAGGDFEESGNPTVEVLHQGTVGPYETVTLGTDEPGALNTWLSEHGYNVDPSTQPIIDSYVAEGFDFIALRLQPGKGIQQMTPVRVVMEGMNLSLPLRMVGIGTGAFTPIVLYVLSEGRYTTANFSEVAIQQSLLSWNFKTSESNYTELRETALAQNEGRSFLTAFAGEAPFFFNDFDGSDGMVASYLNQAFVNNETTTQCQLGLIDASARVVNPCPPGEPWDSAACGTVQEGELDVRALGCTGADDMAVALTGLRPNLTWITRLEANLPRAALDQDLTLSASESQDYVTNLPQAVIALEPEGACPSGLIPRVIQPGETPRSSYFIFGGMLVASAALMSRRRMMRSA